MKQAMIDYMQKPKSDELFTPEEAVLPLLPYIPMDWTIWECTDQGGSNITRLFRDRGNRVVSTHLRNGQDFLTYEPDFDFDCIITNPPYSRKDDFLKRAYELGKPFAFLLPIDSLAGIKRVAMFKQYGIQVLVLDRRINFMKTKKAVWFNTSWFCWNILPEQLVFCQIGGKEVRS